MGLAAWPFVLLNEENGGSSEVEKRRRRQPVNSRVKVSAVRDDLSVSIS